MKKITFITGNQGKADYLAKYLGLPVVHLKLDLDEIQSMDLKEIVERKVKQAYEIIKSPVIVEDVSLEIETFGGFPGPFIRFFVELIPFETICGMVTGKSRKATAKCVFGFYDGQDLKMFEGSLPGEIAETPVGDKGFGFDKFFIPKGFSVTRASLNEEDDRKTYLQMKPFEQLKNYLLSK